MDWIESSSVNPDYIPALHGYKQNRGSECNSTFNLLPRSSLRCYGDEERDMERRLSAQTSKKPTSEGKGPQPYSLYSALNTRSPHPDGNHYRHTSSSFSTTSSYSETGSPLEQKGDGVSMYGSRPTGELYSDKQVNPQSVHRTEPVAYHPHTGDGLTYHSRPPTNFMPYQNDVQTRHGYYERPPGSGFIPSTPGYYEQMSAGGLSPYNPPEDHLYSPGPPGQSEYNLLYRQTHVRPPSLPQSRQYAFDYRQYPHPTIIRANSTGSPDNGGGRQQYLLESQHGYSSLGEKTPTTAHFPHPLESSREVKPPNTIITQEDPWPYRIGSGSYRLQENVAYPSGSNHRTVTAAMDKLIEDTAHVSISEDQYWDSLEIIEHPRDVCVAPGEKAVFTCTAHVRGEDEEVNMLWCKDKEPLIGEIDSEFTIEETTERDEGVYHCLVSHPTNSMMKKESQPANLVVKKQEFQPPHGKVPYIVKQPTEKLIAVVGESLKLSLDAGGEEPLRYQWYKNGLQLKYGQSAVLNYPVAMLDDSGMYSCTIFNDHGSVPCKPFTVEVTRAKAVDLSDAILQTLSKPISHQVHRLDDLAHLLGLSAKDVSYIRHPVDQIFQLLRLWKHKEKGDKKKLQEILNRANIYFDFDVEKTQMSNPLYTGPAPPQIILHPENSEIYYGHSVQFLVRVSNSTPLTKYQWYFNKRPLASQTNPCLVISSVVDSDQGEYVCIVTDRGVQVLSRPATVKIVSQSPGGRVPRRAVPAQQPAGFDRLPKDKLEMSNLIGRGTASVSSNVHQQNNVTTTVKQGTTSNQPEMMLKGFSKEPIIMKHPSSIDVELGGHLLLTCQAVGDDDVSYSWFFNGLLIMGENTSSYTLNCFTDEDEGFYSCRVSNSYGSVISDMAHVRLMDSD